MAQSLRSRTKEGRPAGGRLGNKPLAEDDALREQIARAVEERELRRMCDEDLPQIERLLWFWGAHGCPELYFKVVR